MTQFDTQYQANLLDILNNGEICETRGLLHKRVFGQTTRVDLRQGLPATTLRKIPLTKVLDEALADLQGANTREQFRTAEIFWDGLYNSQGELPHAYGTSYRRYTLADRSEQGWADFDITETYSVDQIKNAVNTLLTDKFSRRLVIQTFDPAKASRSLVPPCHTGFILNTSGDGQFLDMLVTHRSWDASIGKPLDTLRFAFILQILAEMTNLVPRYLQQTSANTHIYNENITEMEKLVKREPKESKLTLTCLRPDLMNLLGLEDLRPEHFELTGYISHPAMKITYVK